jgi:hypothetical protein
MESKTTKLKLTVVHAKCSACEHERILYFTNNFTYGERVISTESGKVCAYVNLFRETVVQELENHCTELYCEKGISVAQNKLARIISSIYGITCDDINGEKIDGGPNNRCPICFQKKMVEDKEYGEQLAEVDVFRVTHYSWEKLDDKTKSYKVKKELIRQGYIK